MLGVIFLLCWLQNPGKTGQRVYGGVASLASLTGIGICLRHIWLQNLPADQVPECGAGFWYMMDTMPMLQFMDTILNGSGECADIQWQFLGFSIPEWTLVLFVVFLAISIVLMFFARKPLVSNNG